MANQEHLDVLRQGVSTWNRWREENPGIRPDLSGADCSGQDLDNLLGSLKRGIIKRAVERHAKLTRKKQEALTTEHADDFQDRPAT